MSILLAGTLLDTTLLQSQSSQIFASPSKNSDDPFGKNSAAALKLGINSPCDPLCPPKETYTGLLEVSFQAEVVTPGGSAGRDDVVSVPVKGNPSIDNELTAFL